MSGITALILIDGFRHTYGQASFVCESRGAVPWLNLIPKDDLDFAFICTLFFDQRSHDSVDSHRQLSADNRTQYRTVLAADDCHLKGQT
jgi:hypothetical protein